MLKQLNKPVWKDLAKAHLAADLACHQVTLILGFRGLDVAQRTSLHPTDERTRIEIPEEDDEVQEVRIYYNEQAPFTWAALLHEYFHAITFSEWPTHFDAASELNVEQVAFFWERLSIEPMVRQMSTHHVAIMTKDQVEVFNRAMAAWNDSFVCHWSIAHTLLIGGYDG